MLSPIFLTKLKSLIDHEKVIDVRGRGFMFAIDLVDKQTANIIFDKLIDRGFIVCNRESLFRIDPPLTISEEEFRDFIQNFKEIVAEI